VTIFLADYPSTITNPIAAGQHYMMIDSYVSRNATASGSGSGLGDKLSSISLYIPAGSLKTSFSGNYEPKEGAALKAGAVAKGGDWATKLKKFDWSSDAAANLLESGKNLLDFGGAAAGGLAANMLDKTGFVSASGNTPNNYMALVYGGPNEFRQHTFDFKFFPKNPDESKNVREIIEEFKRGTLPRMSSDVTGTSASGQTLLDPFFKSPRQHTIKFMQANTNSTNTFLFDIGISVITSMSVNYDPQSMVGFHEDGSPVQIDMSLTFKEIAFQIEPMATTARRNLVRGVSQNQSSVAQEIQAVRNLGLDRTGGPPNRNRIVGKK